MAQELLTPRTPIAGLPGRRIGEPPPRETDAERRRELAAIVTRAHLELVEQLDIDALAQLEGDRSRRAVEEAARSLLVASEPTMPAWERDEAVVRVADEVLGLGPIEALIHDAEISEVMVNDFDEVYIERHGVIEEAPILFADQAHVKRIIDRITSAIGRRVDEATPMVDARLEDGSRVNAAIPPAVPRGPVLTIRKFREDKYTLHDLTSTGTLSAELAEFISLCVKLRLNVMISGGTGSGKTTLLNAVSEAISERERIITIEDPTELRLQQRHVISMETRPANIEGRNAITQTDLFRNALRMRPDRIIVGEVRGAEAFDMMQAMNTGHDGSLTTVHANSPRDALARIENMVLMAGYDLPVRAIREQVASALDVVVHIARLADGQRRITHVSEVVGLEESVVTMQDLFAFAAGGVGENGEILGEVNATGLVPSFVDRFEAAGIDLRAQLIGTGARW
jgi:pilus assembly protein CpaF